MPSLLTRPPYLYRLSEARGKMKHLSSLFFTIFTLSYDVLVYKIKLLCYCEICKLHGNLLFHYILYILHNCTVLNDANLFIFVLFGTPLSHTYPAANCRIAYLYLTWRHVSATAFITTTIWLLIWSLSDIWYTEGGKNSLLQEFWQYTGQYYIEA